MRVRDDRREADVEIQGSESFFGPISSSPRRNIGDRLRCDCEKSHPDFCADRSHFEFTLDSFGIVLHLM
jgi:hypothetical protein